MQHIQSLLDTGSTQNSHLSERSSTTGTGLDSFLTGKAGLATGAAAGGLFGLLLGGKKSRKMAVSAAKVGGVALVGGLAFKAWQEWQAQKNTPTTQNHHPSPNTVSRQDSFLPQETDQRDALSRLIIRAMIAAAKADGHVTHIERDKIIHQGDRFGLDTQDQGFLARELNQSASIEDLAAEAKTPELAAEIYTASLLAVNPQGRVERAYLDLLQARLGLDDSLIRHIHAATYPDENY